MRSPKVFISYTHDSPQHSGEVLGLGDRLRRAGIDCKIDRYHPAPPEGWPAWMSHAATETDFVLVICTRPIQERYDGIAEHGVGKGAKWEGAVMRNELLENEMHNSKWIPVLLTSGNKDHIPSALRGVTYYDLDTTDGYVKLYRRLTDQPEVVPPAVGDIVPMPPQSVQWSGASQPSPEAVVIGFIDDLRPNDADVYEATKAITQGQSAAIRWSELNDDLFETFSVRRPDLRRQLAERGVEEGSEMAASVEAFDLALSTASQRRDGAVERIPLMWSGMEKSSYWQGNLVDSAFRASLRSFLVLVNLYTLMSLGQVQFKEDYRALPGGIEPGETSIELFQRPAVTEAFSASPPFWAVDIEMDGESFYVYAPKQLARTAYRTGASSAGFFMRNFLVPQMELQLLGTDKLVTYEPDSVTVRKVRKEDLEEPDIDDYMETHGL